MSLLERGLRVEDTLLMRLGILAKPVDWPPPSLRRLAHERLPRGAARILAWMNTRAVLFGEILIVVARREPPASGDGAPR